MTNKDFTIGTGRTVDFIFSSSVTEAFVDLIASDGRSNHVDIRSGVTSTIVVPDGTYEVRIGMPGVPITRSSVAGRASTTYSTETGALTVDGNESLDVTLPTLRTISGSVSDGSDAVPDAWVELVETSSGRGSGTKADSSGNYSLSVPNGSYKINAMKPGYFRQPSALTVSADVSGQTLTMATAGITISGQVLVGSNGRANAFVRAERQGGGFAGTQADASGNYSLAVTAGTWRISAIANGYAEQSYPTPITVTDAALTGKDITLSTASLFTVADQSSQTISSSNGGTIDDTDAGVKITAGPNALTSDGSSVILTYEQTTNVPETPGARPLPGFQFSANSDSSINNFNDGIDIEMSYTPAELALQTAADGTSMNTVADVFGTDGSGGLQMATYDPTTNAWDTLPTTLTCEDVNGNPVSNPASLSECTVVTVASVAEHFSLYAPVVATDPSAPDVPSGLAATANGTTGMALTWTQVSGATAYDLYRSTSENGTFSLVRGEPTVSSGATVSYVDTDLSSNTVYYYKITSLNGSMESAASSAVSGRTGGGSGGGGGAVGFSGGGGGGGSSVSVTPVPVPAPAPTSTTIPTVTSTPVTVTPAPAPVATTTVVLPVPLAPGVVVPLPVFDGVMVAQGGSLKFLYGYTNTTKKIQRVRVKREIFNPEGKVVKTATASVALKPGVRWEAKVNEPLPASWKAGDYRSVATIYDLAGRVLYTTKLNIRITVPVVKPAHASERSMDEQIVKMGGLLAYAYGYTNTSKTDQSIAVTREIFDASSKRVKLSVAKTKLKTGARWEAKVSERLPSSWKPGLYRAISTVKDSKTGAVLYTYTRIIHVQAK